MPERTVYINRSNTICHYTRFFRFLESNCNGCNVGDPKMVELLHLFAENGLERRFTMRSVAELEAAAQNDIEMRDYVAYKVGYPDWQASELWHALGWDDARGKAVDRRYRRLLNQLRESGAGMEWRTAPVAGLTSATYFFETLYDGARGTERGVWQHADAIPPTSLPIAPFRPAPSV